MSTADTIFGLSGEEAACHWLVGSGFRILDRNWRRPWGELDIVASKDGTIHFVEVKTARRLVTGFEPFLRANGRKMHKVMRTAQTWLSAHQYSPDTPWQLDIISVIMEGKAPAIEFFENI
ncbi:MAG: YraN family protein [Candidatus Yanofskybacteria bacterium]|nr:YraN family protein [Candidatus Yanofskybacteria bacterium]